MGGKLADADAKAVTISSLRPTCNHHQKKAKACGPTPRQWKSRMVSSPSPVLNFSISHQYSSKAPLNLSLCPYHLQHYPHPIPPPNRCQKLRHSSRPCAVEDAAINIVYPLTIYASVQKQLGEPLGFPGDFNAWDVTKDLSMAELIAYHAEWAVLTNGAVNQALNISDGSEFSYGKFWPILASWYGIKASFPESDTAKYGLLEMPFEPPPRGFGRRGRINATWTFGEWASRKDVQGAWKLLADKYGLKQDPFESAVKTQSTIGLLDAEILGPWPRAISMDASRKLGWNGFVDTREGIRVVVGKLAELGMVPPLEGGVEA